MATIISKSEMYYRNNKNRREQRRNEEGLTNKEAERIKNEKDILELKRKKYTLKQISKELNLSISYVKKISMKMSQ